jgi:hypothetical protein
VDASQGVQAQSISVFHVAQERGLTIIPVLNKVFIPKNFQALPFLSCASVRLTYLLLNLIE